MRQRNIKELEEKIKSNSWALVEEPKKHKGKWNEVFENQAPIYLEIGCGKGSFILKKARKNKDANFIAIEGQSNVCLRALEKAEAEKPENLKIFIGFVNDLREYFDEGEISGIYLNFSDPWPKSRHDKRRLTYHKRIENYMEVMKKDGFIEFKTDNDKLFEFTLEEIELLGLELKELSRDLTDSDFDSKNFTTEYEDKFIKLGKKINYLKIQLA